MFNIIAVMISGIELQTLKLAKLNHPKQKQSLFQEIQKYNIHFEMKIAIKGTWIIFRLKISIIYKGLLIYV